MSTKDSVKTVTKKPSTQFHFKSVIRGTTLLVMSIQLLHLFSKFGVIPVPIFFGFLTAVIARSMALWCTSIWLKRSRKNSKMKKKIVWAELWRFIMLFTIFLWCSLLLLYIINPDRDIDYRQQVGYGAGLTILTPLFIIIVELGHFFATKWRKRKQ